MNPIRGKVSFGDLAALYRPFRDIWRDSNLRETSHLSWSPTQQAREKPTYPMSHWGIGIVHSRHVLPGMIPMLIFCWHFPLATVDNAECVSRAVTAKLAGQNTEKGAEVTEHDRVQRVLEEDAARSQLLKQRRTSQQKLRNFFRV